MFCGSLVFASFKESVPTPNLNEKKLRKKIFWAQNNVTRKFSILTNCGLALILSFSL